MAVLATVVLGAISALERLQANPGTIGAVARGRARQRLDSALRYFSWKKLFNFFRIELQLRLGRTRVSGFPYEWEVDTTNICQLHCPLCHTGLGNIHRDKGVMDYGLFTRVIDQIKDHCIWLTLYSWGEPFLNKDIDRFVAYAHRAGIATIISSNLNKPLTRDMAERIVTSGLDTLIVSIDGTTQDVYQVYRVGGRLERVMANLDLLLQAKRDLRSRTPYIEWQFIVMRHNQHQIAEARVRAKALGVDGIVFKKVDFPLGERDTALAKQWLPVGMEEYKRERPFERPYREDGQRCWRLWRSGVVNWDGGFSPCCYLTDKKDDFGDASRESITAIWNNQHYRSARELFKPRGMPTHQVGCATCPVYTGSQAAKARGHYTVAPTLPAPSPTLSLAPNAGPRRHSERGEESSANERPTARGPLPTAAALFRRLAARDGAAAHARELALLAAAYFAYMFVRKVIVPGAEEIGQAHAEDLIAFEDSLGFFWEPQLQQWALRGGQAVALLFNYLYIFTFFPIVLTAAVIYYFRDRDRYFYYRGLVLLTFVVALAIFAAFPLTPPRFSGHGGFVDTIVRYGPPWYGSREATAYYNAYAAMPSLHFSWTVLFGFLFWNTGPRLLKVLAVLYPLSAFFAIIVTGNHYILDAVAGVGMALIVFLLYHGVLRSGLLTRRLPERLGRRFRPQPPVL